MTIQQKFGRNYRLTIYPVDGSDPIIVTMPFTINFLIKRDSGCDYNEMDLEIYNLAEDHRNRIFRDRYVLGVDPTDGSTAKNPAGDNLQTHNIILEIGYGTLYRVFYGAIFRASSARDGTNIITRIKAFQGNIDMAGTLVFQTLQSGQTLGDVLKFLAGQFKNLQIGAIGDFPQPFTRPVVLNGNVWDLLKQYSNNQVYVDNGKIYVLKTNEVLDNTYVINDETGLLETPRRDQGYLYITTLMESGVDVISGMVNLQSTVQKSYNGTYKIMGIIHQGMISAAVCGRARSVFRLLAPNLFDGFKTIQQPLALGAAQ